MELQQGLVVRMRVVLVERLPIQLPQLELLLILLRQLYLEDVLQQDLR